MERTRKAAEQALRDWQRATGEAYAVADELYEEAMAIHDRGGNDYRGQIREVRQSAVIYQGIIDRSNL